MAKPEMMTVKEVADLMKVTPRTVFRWMQLGRLHPFRIRGKGRDTVRFNRSELLTAIDEVAYGGGESEDPSMG